MLFFAFLSTLSDYERNVASEIFEEYYKKIFEIAYSILHKSHDAEEIIDEVMINVIKNIDRFVNASGNDIEAQLVIYSRNAAINLYNKNKRRNTHVGSITYQNEDGEYEDIDIAAEDTDIDEILLSAETAKIVKDAVMLLPDKLRDVVELVYGLEYSNIEAARVLGVTPNTVGLRLLRAKKKLIELAGGELNERF